MNKAPVIAFAVIVLVLVLVAFFVVRSNAANTQTVANTRVSAPQENSVQKPAPQASPIVTSASVKPNGIVAGDEVSTSESGNIMVSSPKANSTIGNSVIISGNARVFENVVSYRILDGKGIVLAEGTTIATPPDIGQLGPFSVTPTWNTPKTITGTIEVFSTSAKDGSVINLVTIPVGFAL